MIFWDFCQVILKVFNNLERRISTYNLQRITEGAEQQFLHTPLAVQFTLRQQVLRRLKPTKIMYHFEANTTYKGVLDCYMFKTAV